MPNLAPIVYNAETISARHAPSLNAAFKELFEASGIKPIVVTPDGGARTAAEQQALASVSDWWTSDHYENNPAGHAAIDLWNQRTFRNWDEPRFLAIMAKWGWRNIQINGRPFPSEPWHFANHDQTPLMPAGIIIAPHRNENDMTDLHLIKDGKATYIGVAGRDKLIHIKEDRAVTNIAKVLKADAGTIVDLGSLAPVLEVEKYLALAKPTVEVPK